MTDNGMKIVRVSYCKKCKKFIRSMAIESMTDEIYYKESLEQFDKEVEEYDLGVDTVTVNRFKSKYDYGCECE
jgi:hypothetical protein